MTNAVYQLFMGGTANDGTNLREFVAQEIIKSHYGENDREVTLAEYREGGLQMYPKMLLKTLEQRRGIQTEYEIMQSLSPEQCAEQAQLEYDQAVIAHEQRIKQETEGVKRMEMLLPKLRAWVPEGPFAPSLNNFLKRVNINLLEYQIREKFPPAPWEPHKPEVPVLLTGEDWWKAKLGELQHMLDRIDSGEQSFLAKRIENLAIIDSVPE